MPCRRGPAGTVLNCRNQGKSGGPRWRAMKTGRDPEERYVVVSQVTGSGWTMSMGRFVTDAECNCAAVMQTGQALPCGAPISCSKACAATPTCATSNRTTNSTADTNRDSARSRIIILRLLQPHEQFHHLIVLQSRSSADICHRHTMRAPLRCGRSVVDRPDEEIRPDVVSRAVVAPEVSALLDVQPARAVE